MRITEALLATHLEGQGDAIAKAFQDLLHRATLAVGLGDFRAEGDKPTVFALLDDRGELISQKVVPLFSDPWSGGWRGLARAPAKCTGRPPARRQKGQSRSNSFDAAAHLIQNAHQPPHIPLDRPLQAELAPDAVGTPP